jgi:hypothetical protein
MATERVEAIDRDQLLNVLGYPDGKLPDEAKIFNGVNCPNKEGLTVVTANVVIKEPGKRRNTARMIVVCPQCGKEVSFGKFHQHKGSKACQTPSPNVRDDSLKRGSKRIARQEPGPQRQGGERAGQGMGAADGHRAGRGHDAQNAAIKARRGVTPKD